jgi:hypothetical protein
MARKDNDDDGETAAGSRLAHLLSILVRVRIDYPILTLFMIYLHSRRSTTCSSWSQGGSEGYTSVRIGSSTSTMLHGMHLRSEGFWTRSKTRQREEKARQRAGNADLSVLSGRVCKCREYSGFRSGIGLVSIIWINIIARWENSCVPQGLHGSLLVEWSPVRSSTTRD